MTKSEKVMQLKEFTENELSEELKRRKNKVRPSPQSEINWSGIIQQCEECLDLLEDDALDEDYQYLLFESVMTTIYGKKIWVWWNGKNG